MLIVAVDDDDDAILHPIECCLRCMFIFDLTLVDNSVALRRRLAPIESLVCVKNVNLCAALPRASKIGLQKSNELFKC